MKIKDLTFIDLGLPSGNKFCFQLINNLYQVHDWLKEPVLQLLPTIDEIREMVIYSTIQPYTKEIEEQISEEDSLTITQSGVIIGNAYYNSFIPFLGSISHFGLCGENTTSVILTTDPLHTGRFCGTAFFKDHFEFESTDLGLGDGVQILLVQRNESN